jgi:hypothetical protein
VKTQEHEKDVSGVAHTYFDSINPFRFLKGVELSPFLAYGWRVAGALLNMARHPNHGPKGGQGDVKESHKDHTNNYVGDEQMLAKTLRQFITLGSLRTLKGPY